jgi:hypothetical protein
MHKNIANVRRITMMNPFLIIPLHENEATVKSKPPIFQNVNFMVNFIHKQNFSDLCERTIQWINNKWKFGNCEKSYTH